MAEGEERRHRREYIVIPALISMEDLPPLACGLVDISVSGARIRSETEFPESVPINLIVEKLKIRTKGTIVRVYSTSTGYDVAIKFDKLHPELPGRLLEYKLRSHSGGLLSRR